MSASGDAGFRVVIPVKDLARAKTRLELTGPTRRSLALAFATDTIRAALSSVAVDEVVVLTRDRLVSRRAASLGATVLRPPRGRGLNPELEWALSGLGRTGGPPAAVLMADLPALRPWELDAVLAAGREAGGPFCVEDRSSGGTTLLGGPVDRVLPCFGGRSAARHRVGGAVGLGEHAPGLRCDVDDLEGLSVAVGLGVNPATRDALAERDVRVSPVPAAVRATAGGAAWTA